MTDPIIAATIAHARHQDMVRGAGDPRRVVRGEWVRRRTAERRERRRARVLALVAPVRRRRPRLAPSHST